MVIMSMAEQAHVIASMTCSAAIFSVYSIPMIASSQISRNPAEERYSFCAADSLPFIRQLTMKNPSTAADISSICPAIVIVALPSPLLL